MYSTEGIILKRTEAGEADSLFTIYTKDYGKIRALAQGVRKSAAKLKGHLEPLSHSEIYFVLGKNGERLVGASLINYWDSLREDLRRLRAARKIAADIDRYCLNGEKDEGIWRLLAGTLLDLEKNQVDGDGLEDFLKSFEEKFLECLGYGGEKGLGFLDSEF